METTYTPEYKTFTVNNISFRMVKIPAGQFIMGDDKSKYEEEKPEHLLKISSFYMAEFQVTQEFYEAVTGKNPSRFKGKKHPVESVSWYDSVKFCNKLSEILKLEKCYTDTENPEIILTGNTNLTEKEYEKQNKPLFPSGFRLATEAEWEYAAKGQTKLSEKLALKGSELSESYKTYAGSNNLEHVGWFDKNNEYETKPVGLKFPNAFGLYDMSGNVWEWCNDMYDEKFYEKCKSSNSVHNLLNSEGTNRVLRGGGWYGGDIRSRVVRRIISYPDDNGNGVGLGLVFSL